MSQNSFDKVSEKEVLSFRDSVLYTNMVHTSHPQHIKKNFCSIRERKRVYGIYCSAGESSYSSLNSRVYGEACIIYVMPCVKSVKITSMVTY